MRNYLKKWDFVRLLRFMLGVFVITQGVFSGEWLLVFAGCLFALMPIFNVGCCGVAGCNTQNIKTNKKLADTTFEELH